MLFPDVLVLLPGSGQSTLSKLLAPLEPDGVGEREEFLTSWLKG